jgi:predicted nuclease of predicted toxin-antitoxin system
LNTAKPLSFLADESCDFSVIRALRKVGYSVKAIAEVSPSLPDEAVLELAVAENRLLITEDKDFGEWVFAHQHAMTGVLLIRYPVSMRSSMIAAVVDLIGGHAPDLDGSFTVLEPGRARIRKKIKD